MFNPDDAAGRLILLMANAGGDARTVLSEALQAAYNHDRDGAAPAADALELLHELEWSGARRGQGTGPMSSGGDGPLVRMCPVCRGIDPSDPHLGHFTESSHGHQQPCRLARVLYGDSNRPGSN